MFTPLSMDVACCKCGVLGGLEIVGFDVVSGLGENPRKIKFEYKCIPCYAVCFQIFQEDQMPYYETQFLKQSGK
jgi:hypothetical protein